MAPANDLEGSQQEAFLALHGASGNHHRSGAILFEGAS
jgi:hypothetical protein